MGIQRGAPFFRVGGASRAHVPPRPLLPLAGRRRIALARRGGRWQLQLPTRARRPAPQSHPAVPH
eukprot:5731034-Prymnesium_polylepis.1